MYIDVNDEKSNQRFILFSDYSISEKIYSYEEAKKIEEKLSGTGFFVDESIAQAVSELNKKGYFTKYCCSGHLLKNRKPVKFTQSKVTLDSIPQKKQYLSPKNGFLKIAEDEENILFLSKGACSQSYITFADGIELYSAPEGFFIYSDEHNIIRADVECCIEENGKLRFINDNEAREQLRQISKNLLNWANSLPYKKTSLNQKSKR